MEYTVFDKLYRTGIVPVAVLPSPDCALPLARALKEGLLPCVEVTFRTEGAADAIRAIRTSEPDILVGAGTVLTVEQAANAIEAGAQFIVAPGLNAEVVEYVLSRGVPMIPGVATASEVEAAMKLGLDTVKFFPAEQAGGADYLKALAGPYKAMKFMPTGGVNLKNLTKYLAMPNVIACGGSWMVPADLMKQGKYDEIAQLCREAVLAMLDLRLAHVGISSPSADDALGGAKTLAALLGLEVIENAASVFSATYVEWMKGCGRGDYGHIGFHVSNMDRAVAWLERRGIEYLPETYVKKDGKYGAIYLREQIGGFAIHLTEDE